ncbi:MAG: hypothetical protein RL660_2142 [Bacteroidota bacterium]|jgi:2-keto-4-pentenoate hydratase/2-oxohepta-3-ene-1,7-dioic acid hydratase in catechol pathway
MKIICVGRNYAAHAAELANAVPSKPVLFLKPQTALLKGKDFYIPSFTKNLHFECELVLRIGKTAKHVQPQFAHRYINAYSLGIDFTARDLQDEQKAQGLPWEIAKAFDNSAVCGDFVEVENILEHLPLHFQFYQNNELKQSGDTSLMLFDIPTLVANITSYFTLQAGDLIYTGTPAGVAGVTIGDQLRAEANGQVFFEIAIK